MIPDPDSSSRREVLRWARATAHQIKGTRSGQAVAKHLRPHLIPLLSRDGGPLWMTLYIACIERAIISTPESCAFAILEPPTKDRKPEGTSNGRARGMRILGELFFLTCFWPTLMLLAVAACCVPFRTHHEAQILGRSSLILCILVTLYVLLTHAIRGVITIYRALLIANEKAVDDETFHKLMKEHWSVRLIFSGDQSDTRSIVNRCMEVIVDRKPKIGPTALLIDLRAVTSSDGRAAVTSLDTAAIFPLSSQELAVIATHDAPELSLPRDAEHRQLKGLPVIGLAVLLTLLFGAKVVSWSELEACSKTTCVGHPATFASAFYWLFERLTSGDPNGISAGTWFSRLIGVMMSLFGWFLLGTVATWIISRSTLRMQRLPVEKIQDFNARYQRAKRLTVETGRLDTHQQHEIPEQGDRTKEVTATKRAHIFSIAALLAAGIAGYGVARATATRSGRHKRSQTRV